MCLITRWPNFWPHFFADMELGIVEAGDQCIPGSKNQQHQCCRSGPAPPDCYSHPSMAMVLSIPVSCEFSCPQPINVLFCSSSWGSYDNRALQVCEATGAEVGEVTPVISNVVLCLHLRLHLYAIDNVLPHAAFVCLVLLS